jgi:pteridine reductase
MTAGLQGKVILVTGGARRVGAAIVRRLHAAGASIMLHYRSAATVAEALAEELGAVGPGTVRTWQADLLDADALPGLVQATLGAFGQIDGLVNNASSFFATPIGAIRDPDWTDLIGTNLRAPLFLSQAAAPALRHSRGAIVNIVDIHAERPLPRYPVYCAAKAGLVGLTRALAIELAPEVRVNGVAPGPIAWPAAGGFDSGERAAIVEHTLLKRIGDPDDIAGAVEYLLLAPYVTGHILAVDGGRSAHL